MGYLASRLTALELHDEEIRSITEIIQNRILSVSKPNRIVLFGSAAAGRMSQASDFDVAIIFDDSADLKDKQKKILRANLFRDLDVDLLFFSDSEFARKSQVGGVCWEIERTGKVLYDQRTKV